MSLWNASLAVMSGLLLSAYAHPVWLLGAAGAWAAAAAFVPRAYRGRLAVYSFLSILAGLYFYGYEILQQSEMKPLAAQERTVWVRGEIASGVKRDGDVARFFADVGQWREEGESWQQLGLNETIVLRVKLSAARKRQQSRSGAQAASLWHLPGSDCRKERATRTPLTMRATCTGKGYTSWRRQPSGTRG